MFSLMLKLNKKVSFNKGSRLQGFIMENLDSEYAEYLHTMQYHPYTQYIETIDNSTSLWNINLLDGQAIDNIKKMINIGDTIKLDSDEEISIIDIQYDEITEDNLLKELSIVKPNRYARIKIITPAAFKSYGEYYFWPDVKLIFNSIINRFNKFSSNFTLEDTDIINDIVENFVIVDYNIKTRNFYLEGIKIKGFVGNITFRFNGTMQLANIGNMLLKYGEFTGIGIKTSMGMGGFKILKEDE